MFFVILNSQICAREIVKLLPLGGYEQGFVIFSGQILFRKHDDSLQASSPFGGAGGGGEEIMLQHGACCHVPRWPHLVHHNWRACS